MLANARGFFKKRPASPAPGKNGANVSMRRRRAPFRRPGTSWLEIVFSPFPRVDPFRTARRTTERRLFPRYILSRTTYVTTEHGGRLFRVARRPISTLRNNFRFLHKPLPSHKQTLRNGQPTHRAFHSEGTFLIQPKFRPIRLLACSINYSRTRWKEIEFWQANRNIIFPLRFQIRCNAPVPMDVTFLQESARS